MTWLLSALSLAKEAASVALWHIRRYPLQCLLVTALCVAAWALWSRGNAIDQRDAAIAQIDTERKAHKQTETNYRAASLAALKAAQAKADSDKAKYQQIAEREQNALEARLADTDAVYRRLLKQTAQANSRRADTVGVSSPTDPSCVAFGAACTPELLAALRDAEDNTSRLIGWQDWWRAVAVVN